MWLILQLLIMFAVLASNVHWQWAPNSLVAGLIGFAVAYSLPWVLGSPFGIGITLTNRGVVAPPPLYLMSNRAMKRSDRVHAIRLVKQFNLLACYRMPHRALILGPWCRLRRTPNKVSQTFLSGQSSSSLMSIAAVVSGLAYAGFLASS
jgi:hypothetical protein